MNDSRADARLKEAEAFDVWWNEVENFSLRSERAVDDMRNDPKYFLPRWMRAAFDAGVRAAIEAYQASAQHEAAPQSLPEPTKEYISVVAQDGEVYPASPDDEIEFPAPRGMD